MPRAHRIDGPGEWHHVMNRGIAKRTLFETREDVRMFLAGLAREVHAGTIEVHAFCILTTHFHLLVRSTSGELSEVMQRLENGFSRYFNRLRRRDGPLFRGRYRSKLVRSHEYRMNLVRYIDLNAVHAGLAPTPAQYPYCSARWYSQQEGPPWLTRDWVEEEVRSRHAIDSYEPGLYASIFGGRFATGISALIESRLDRTTCSHDPLDDLLKSANGEMLEWMRKKAMLADGTGVGLPVCTNLSVVQVIQRKRHEMGPWEDPISRKKADAWPQVSCALLRDLCGATWAETALVTGQSIHAARRAYARHRASLARNESYALRAAELARMALRNCHTPTS